MPPTATASRIRTALRMIMFSTVARFPSPGARAPSPPHRVGHGVRTRGRRPAHPRTRARAAVSRARSSSRGSIAAHPRTRARAAVRIVLGDRLACARAAAGPALDRHLRPHRLACARAAVRPPSRSAAADIVTARGGTLASHRARKRRQRTPRAPPGGDRPPDKGVRRAHVGHVQPTNDAVGRDASPLATPRAFAAGGQAGRRRSQCSGAFAAGRQYTHPAPRA